MQLLPDRNANIPEPAILQPLFQAAGRLCRDALSLLVKTVAQKYNALRQLPDLRFTFLKFQAIFFQEITYLFQELR